MNLLEKHLCISRDICVAYLSNNRIPADEIDILFSVVYQAIAKCHRVEQSYARQIRPIGRKSILIVDIPSTTVHPDGIVSFIDGRTYKTLKRHLFSHGLTPKAYREKFGLDEDYPMVASNYAAKRSAIAMRTGLGRPGFIRDLAARKRNLL